ncbi:hypothetical protein [Brevibacillus marinus]|uniref:hypothetical protein n=1 Tax=Brevibacillus marinus TaxID=2496837 RepID=UPI000F84882A|nr:hypothetical protein [Brevibacillus marinus]
MQKTATVYSFLLVAFLFLIGYGTSTEFFANDDKRNIKIRETVRFPADFFLPNLQEQTFEFVYTVSDNSLQYELYRYPEFRILTREEHLNLQHPHALHDRFFSYEQSRGERDLLSRKQIGSLFQIDIKHVRELTYRQRLYGDALLEYESDGITGYWVLNPNSTESLSVPIAKLQRLIDFLKAEQITVGRILVVDLERMDQIWFVFPHYQWTYQVIVYSDDLASLPDLLKGIGGTHPPQKQASQPTF